MTVKCSDWSEVKTNHRKYFLFLAFSFDSSTYISGGRPTINPRIDLRREKDTRDLIVFVYISVKAIFVVQNKTERNNVAKHSRQVKFIKI